MNLKNKYNHLPSVQELESIIDFIAERTNDKNNLLIEMNQEQFKNYAESSASGL